MIMNVAMTQANVMIAVAASDVLHYDVYWHHKAGTAIADTSGEAGQAHRRFRRVSVRVWRCP